MPYWFHGTREENVESILKNGFYANSFFGKELDNSLRLGCGEVVFWVWFDEDPTDYWEWVCREPISADHIRAVARMNPEILYENKVLEADMRRKFHAEEYPDTDFCEHCEGMGQMNRAPFFRAPQPDFEACPICDGFGRLRKDGKKCNEPTEEEIKKFEEMPEGSEMRETSNEEC